MTNLCVPIVDASCLVTLWSGTIQNPNYGAIKIIEWVRGVIVEIAYGVVYDPSSLTASEVGQPERG